jgi:hypothetical protein
MYGRCYLYLYTSLLCLAPFGFLYKKYEKIDILVLVFLNLIPIFLTNLIPICSTTLVVCLDPNYPPRLFGS